MAVSLRWDAHPFILLNLVFSTQAAYAAPLILLAQTRQADRDKALAEADAKHREALAEGSSERQEIAARQGEQLRALLESNTAVTEQNARLTETAPRAHTRDTPFGLCSKALSHPPSGRLAAPGGGPGGPAPRPRLEARLATP